MTPTQLQTLSDALYSAGVCIATHPGDWSLDRREAWIYGIILGWGDRLRFGWSNRAQSRLRDYRHAVESLQKEFPPYKGPTNE